MSKVTFRGLLSSLLSLVLIIFPIQATRASSTYGFVAVRQSEQAGREAQLDALLKRENLRDWMQRMSARPHHVGSPAGRENAEFIAAQFRSWGYQTEIEEFKVLFPTPRTRVVELIAPESYRARLEEPPLKEDRTSSNVSEGLPTYNAYSVDGDVTGELVYVNYGLPRDYEELRQRGVDVRGKIVIARYGASWRGIKPKVAAEHGAIGCIIYSDPRDDGYFQGDVYPKGAWRNEWSVQRGSVADMPLYPGDPLTPNVGATDAARRLDRKEAPTLTKIPVLPISYGDALPLLRALGGPVAPPDWRGALPITYHIGPGPAKVHLKLEFDWKLVPAYDVIARLPGAELPDEWIIRGNHYDAWVFGADDPLSGLVAMLEEARAIGQLVKNGWRPKRSIVYCAWDGEEPGLLGSTEWVEAHAEELRQKAAVYINSDSNGRGFLGVGGSHTLERFANETARAIPDPQKGISVWERLRDLRLVRGSAEEKREARERRDLRIAALGSGSDYTPFLQHIGIASLNIGYGGEDGGGSYHSNYDSFDHFTRFIDPNFDYGLALAKTGGRLVMRLADADVLPLAFNNFADTVGLYVRELMRLTDSMREETEERNRLLDERALINVADPQEKYVPPEREAPVPHLNFAPLQNALARLQEASRRYDQVAERAFSGRRMLSREERAALDRLLIETERAMTRDEGLPRRPWFKHQVYAPGFYTGYGVKTLPGVREAIEQRNWEEADREIEIVAQTLRTVADRIERAAMVLEGR
ncbi:MAG: folate hydrolase [Pyrinomonas sp.]|mgnify:FL=1|uniref:M28 family metallopeptidase n=1 Tax=Pyrinomonas sp. TaxID=2080306 RepID=UPI00332EB6BE